MTTTIEKCARPTSWSEANDLVPMMLPPLHVLLDTVGGNDTKRNKMHACRVRILRKHSVQLGILLASQDRRFARVAVHLCVESLGNGFDDALLPDGVRANLGQS